MCGSCGWCNRANPLLLPAPVPTSHTDVLHMRVAPKPPKPSVVPSPLLGPPSNKTYTTKKLPGPLFCFFFSSFFVALMRDSENADAHGFEATTAFHPQRAALVRSSHVYARGHHCVPTRAALMISTRHVGVQNPSLLSCQLARWKNRWGKIGKSEETCKEAQVGGVDTHRGGHPADSAAKPSGLCPSSMKKPGCSIL